jgi:hypothetical protein
MEGSNGGIASWYKARNGPLDRRIRLAAHTLGRYPWVTTPQAPSGTLLVAAPQSDAHGLPRSPTESLSTNSPSTRPYSHRSLDNEHSIFGAPPSPFGLRPRGEGGTARSPLLATSGSRERGAS